MTRYLPDGSIMRDTITVSRTTFYRRVAAGWNPLDAATAPPGARNPNARTPHTLFCSDGRPAVQAAEANGIHVTTFRARIAHGWTPDDAATVPAEPQNRYTAPDGRPWVRHALDNGIGRQMFYNRLQRGWEPDEAATLPKGTRI